MNLIDNEQAQFALPGLGSKIRWVSLNHTMINVMLCLSWVRRNEVRNTIWCKAVGKVLAVFVSIFKSHGSQLFAQLLFVERVNLDNFARLEIESDYG